MSALRVALMQALAHANALVCVSASARTCPEESWEPPQWCVVCRMRSTLLSVVDDIDELLEAEETQGLVEEHMRAPRGSLARALAETVARHMEADDDDLLH